MNNIDISTSISDFYMPSCIYNASGARCIKKYELIKLLCKYITIFHNIHEDEIELALFSNNLTELFSK